jgi:hypothetical protein
MNAMRVVGRRRILEQQQRVRLDRAAPLWFKIQLLLLTNECRAGPGRFALRDGLLFRHPATIAADEFVIYLDEAKVAGPAMRLCHIGDGGDALYFFADANSSFDGQIGARPHSAGERYRRHECSARRMAIRSGGIVAQCGRKQCPRPCLGPYVPDVRRGTIQQTGHPRRDEFGGCALRCFGSADPIGVVLLVAHHHVLSRQCLSSEPARVEIARRPRSYNCYSYPDENKIRINIKDIGEMAFGE